MAGHLPADRVRNALDKEHSGSEGPQIVDVEIVDFVLNRLPQSQACG